MRFPAWAHHMKSTFLQLIHQIHHMESVWMELVAPIFEFELIVILVMQLRILIWVHSEMFRHRNKCETVGKLKIQRSNA